MATKAVIFDLWNTLAYNKGARENPIVMLSKRLGLNLNLYREVEEGFMTRRFGTKEEAMESLCRHIGVKAGKGLVESLVGMWNGYQLAVTLFPDVAPALKKLRKKYRIGLISNTECFSIREFVEKGYGSLFDYTAFSCELGMLKPDPRIFEAVMARLGAAPEETVMVGDNLHDDVLAAEKLGIRGVLIKREYLKFRAKPSHIETGTHNPTIKDLTQLEGLL